MPTITNKEIRRDMNRQQQLIRNMILTDTEELPQSIPESYLWCQKMTPSILRRKKFNYSVSLQQGQSLLLHFSVFQHDVGFGAYFNTQQSVTIPLLSHV